MDVSRERARGSGAQSKPFENPERLVRLRRTGDGSLDEHIDGDGPNEIGAGHEVCAVDRAVPALELERPVVGPDDVAVATGRGRASGRGPVDRIALVEALKHPIA